MAAGTLDGGIDAELREVQEAGRCKLNLSREVVVAGALGALCLAARLVYIDRYTGSYAEGVRAEQLLLMAAGFRPFRDIFSDQGPWLLQAFYPGYALFDGALVGVRAASIVGSLAGLIGLTWSLRLVGGPIAGLTALALLGMSPLYLYLSRLAVAETVALAPAIFAVGSALHFARCASRCWLIAAGLLLGLSLLIKPIALAAAAPVALAVWSVRHGRWRNLALVGSATAGIVLVGVAAVGLDDVLQQILQFRLASRHDAGWRPLANLSQVQVQLAYEGGLLLALAVVGTALAARRRVTWPLLAWAAGGVITLLAHTPLHTKHISVLVVPLAALAAYGAARVLAWGSSRLRHGPGRAVAGVGCLVLCAVLVQPVLARDYRLVSTQNLSERDKSFPWYEDGAETIRRVVAPDEYLVTDHSYLAYAARRMVPPWLVEASATRVHAGSLTDGMAIDITDRYRSRAVLLWASKLDDLRKYRAWLKENYLPTKVWAAEDDTRPVLWLRKDEWIPAGRDALRAGLVNAPATATFGGWQLISYGLDHTTPAPGGAVSATLEWELRGEPVPDPLVTLALVDADGRTVEDEQELLLGGAGGARWLFWVGIVPIPSGTTPGDYGVKLTVLDRGGRSLGSAVDVGRLTVQSQ